MPSPHIIKGLSEENIRKISQIKKEPTWMLKKRLEAYKVFLELPLPKWGPSLKEIDFDNIIYYYDPDIPYAKNWDDVPAEVREKLDALGIPEVEKKFLAGLSTQWESKMIYNKIHKDLEKKGVIFTDMDSAVKEHKDIVKEYFGKIIPPQNNKFAALNTAVWSGGTFVYVPENTIVKLPLHTFFRMEKISLGQFERSLIILEKNSEVKYIEGCAAPYYSSHSLHAGVVEAVVKENAKLKYITLQNWSKNVYNLVTKRAHAYKNAVVEWIDGNIGSKITMKYPSIFLLGEGAKANILSISYTTSSQIQDIGGKIYHLAKNTRSKIISKSIVKNKGKNVYRALINIHEKADNSETYSKCDTLLLDEESYASSYPYNHINNSSSTLRYEATTGKIEDKIFFYLQSRGFKKKEIESMVVLGFIEEFLKELPFEYAIEFNKILKLEIEGN